MKAVLVAGICMLLLAGCAQQSGPDADSSPAASNPSADSPWPSRTTLTASSLQPPPQTKLEPGAKPVRFDPCTFISDELIRKAGGRPETRKRNDFTGEHPFFFCTVKGQAPHVQSLDMESTSYTLANHRARKDSTITDIRINGRDAVRYFFRTRAVYPSECSVYMQAPDGTFGVSINGWPHLEPFDTCAAATTAATILEAALEGK